MKKKLSFIFLAVLLTFIVNDLFATAQIADRLVIGKDTVRIYSNPLEQYFKEKGQRTINAAGFEGACTALWRGYVATWKLENDSLFLVRVQTNYCSSPKDIDISKEFGSDKVFAKWVNGPIVRPHGELLQYVHMGYASLYEKEDHYTFVGGLLTETVHKSFLEKESSRVNPGVESLTVTIGRMISQSIAKDERGNFGDDEYCIVNIRFNPEGEISEIKIRPEESIFGKMVFDKTQLVLQNFPLLMKVKHERYAPPILNIRIKAH